MFILFDTNTLQAAGHQLHPAPLRSGDSAHLLYNLRNKVKALQTENLSLKTPTKQRYTSSPDLTANYSFTEEVRTWNLTNVNVPVLRARSHCDGNDIFFNILVSSIDAVTNGYSANKQSCSNGNGILRPKIVVAVTVWTRLKYPSLRAENMNFSRYHHLVMAVMYQQWGLNKGSQKLKDELS